MKNIDLITKTFEDQMNKKVAAVHEYEGVPNNRVCKIETDSQPYIFKIFSSGWPEDGKLPFIISKLAEHQVPHAKLLKYSREDENFPNGYLIEECLAGTTADRLSLSKSETIEMYEKLAVLVSQVHKIRLSGYGYIGNGIAEWASFSEFMCDSLHDNITVLKERQMISEREIKNIENEIQKRLEKCDSCPAVLIHGDLSAKNVIVHEKNITLIDWDDSYSLCWVTDIAALTLKMKWQYGDDAKIYREAFLSKYTTDCNKNLFYEAEDILHVRYGIDALSFSSGNPNYHNTVDVTKIVLRESLEKCGMEVLHCL